MRDAFPFALGQDQAFEARFRPGAIKRRAGSNRCVLVRRTSAIGGRLRSARSALSTGLADSHRIFLIARRDGKDTSVPTAKPCDATFARPVHAVAEAGESPLQGASPPEPVGFTPGPDRRRRSPRDSFPRGM